MYVHSKGTDMNKAMMKTSGCYIVSDPTSRTFKRTDPVLCLYNLRTEVPRSPHGWVRDYTSSLILSCSRIIRLLSPPRFIVL